MYGFVLEVFYCQFSTAGFKFCCILRFVTYTSLYSYYINHLIIFVPTITAKRLKERCGSKKGFSLSKW